MAETTDISAYVKDAHGFLTEKFGISGVEIPKVEFNGCKVSHYDPQTKTLVFESNLVSADEFDKRRTVGHEMAHYLHFTANPEFVRNYISAQRTAACDSCQIRPFATYYHFAEAVADFAGCKYAMQRCCPGTTIVGGRSSPNMHLNGEHVRLLGTENCQRYLSTDLGYCIGTNLFLRNFSDANAKILVRQYTLESIEKILKHFVDKLKIEADLFSRK